MIFRTVGHKVMMKRGLHCKWMLFTKSWCKDEPLGQFLCEFDEFIIFCFCYYKNGIFVAIPFSVIKCFFSFIREEERNCGIVQFTLLLLGSTWFITTSFNAYLTIVSHCLIVIKRKGKVKKEK